jgi:signal transduction histidine kinase/DNA-binding response OmpR family regulator
MKKRLTLILILLCISSLLSAQNTDSLYQALEGHTQDDSLRVKLLLQIARIEFYSHPNKMLSLAQEALEISEKINYDKGLGKCYTYLGIYYRSLGNIDKVADNAMKMLEVFERMGDDDGIAQAYTMLGLVHQEWKNYDKTKFYHQKALEINLKAGRKYDVSLSYINLGVVSGLTGDYEEALKYFKKHLTLKQELGDTAGISDSYINLGHTSLNKSDLKEAIHYFEMAIPIVKKMGRKNQAVNRSATIADERLASIYMGLAETNAKNKNLERAVQYADSALVTAKKIKNKVRINEVYKVLSEIEKLRQRYKEALIYSELFYAYQDSIFTENKLNQITELEAKYETEKKEQTISLLEKDNEIKSLSRNFLLAGLASVMLIGALLFYFQRQKNKRNQVLLKKQEELNVKLLEADHLKSRFFANISHEFRTPLTLILTPVEEKLFSENLSQKDKISFQSIRRSANRLLELINQLLDQSKLESGFMKLQLQPGKLYNFVMPILSSFDSLADVSKVQFSKEIRIPEFTVMFDSDKLEKILNNLLSNAFKFSSPSERVDMKAIATEIQGSITLNVEIKNSGTVIPPDQLDRIFDPFFQGEHTPRHNMQGTGLGLSLVKELVKLHRGEINVSSSPGVGTVFIVTLPFERSNMPEVIPGAEKAELTNVLENLAENGSEEPDITKETVLVVEDNHEVRTLIRRGLEPQYNILEASTGKEGVQLAREKQTDLVISDVMMPVMNGVELCHLLKGDEITSHIPVILLTARADHESKLEGLRTGADDYIIKPFNMPELLARINNLIEQRKKLIRKYKDRIVVQPHEITVTPLDERFIQRALHLIENNLDNIAFDVEKMTSELGISRTNLHRKLKSITGMSTSEFIQDFRLRRAALLIEKRADSISQIAYQVGFNDQSYFTKCFKKKFGKTPSEFAAASVNSA